MLLQRCLDVARQMAYTHCYVEAASGMSCPVSYLERHGFEKLTEQRQDSKKLWLRMQLYADSNTNLYI
jgi:N-acetylglutamate synthase-like GNAT family acetyltransferase